MMDEIANQDIENTAENAKSSEEAMKVVKEVEKLLEVTNVVNYGLPINKGKYLKDLNWMINLYTWLINLGSVKPLWLLKYQT